MVGKCLLQNGHLVDPANGIDSVKDILIADGKIVAVEDKIEVCEEYEVLDLSGKYVFPGFLDLHVHLRDPGLTYKETLSSGSNAAAHGGFTGICPMPNTKPVTDTAEKITALLDRAKTEACVRIYPIAAVTLGQEGKELIDFAAVKKAGAVAVSEDGKSVMDIRLYEEAMRQAKEAGLLVCAHCEDKALVGNGVINEGLKSKEYGLPGISNAVEDIITARDIFLAGETGAKLHLCHCSTKASCELVSMAKKLGYQVTAEVCPHHFTMCDEDISANDGKFKMNPPLRSREDMEALREGLTSGCMEVISTDHAPHSEEEKAGGFLNSPFGIVGLETSFALGYTALVQNGSMSLSELIAHMSTNPARILGVEGGELSVGKNADLCVVELSPYVIDPKDFVSLGKNSPFGGQTVTGKVQYTLVNGRIVYKNERMEENV